MVEKINCITQTIHLTVHAKPGNTYIGLKCLKRGHSRTTCQRERDETIDMQMGFYSMKKKKTHTIVCTRISV